jgi:large subunit ribosomal protein L2
LYRVLDFRGYDKLNIPARVATIEYDPYRTAWIALLHYADGEKRYVLAWRWISVGDTVICGDQALLKPGNRKILKDIPDGFTVYTLELLPQTKGKIIRSAGQSGIISWRDEEKKLVYVKLPSGEVRMFYETCRATIGVVSNEDHKNIVIGKAGRMRWMWRKPVVLGKSMNPVDHPHGGGEGHTDLGLKYPKAFNGRPVAPGMKTRASKKASSKFITQRRKTRFK